MSSSASSAPPPPLQVIYEAAGRPGIAKFQAAANRAGLQLTATQAQEFVRKQSESQVFRAPPRSSGKVTAPRRNQTWQADVIDYKSKSPAKNEGYKAVLVCIDVFSRYLFLQNP